MVQDRAETLHAEGNELFKQREYKAALLKYEQVLAALSRSESVYDQNPGAKVNVQEGPGKSSASLSQCKPLRVKALTNMVQCYLRLGMLEKGVEMASTALKLDSCNVKALYHRAGALQSQGRIRDALHDIVAALKMEPQNAELKRRLSSLQEEVNRTSTSDPHRDSSRDGVHQTSTTVSESLKTLELFAVTKPAESSRDNNATTSNAVCASCTDSAPENTSSSEGAGIAELAVQATQALVALTACSLRTAHLRDKVMYSSVTTGSKDVFSSLRDALLHAHRRLEIGAAGNPELVTILVKFEVAALRLMVALVGSTPSTSGSAGIVDLKPAELRQLALDAPLPSDKCTEEAQQKFRRSGIVSRALLPVLKLSIRSGLSERGEAVEGGRWLSCLPTDQNPQLSQTPTQLRTELCCLICVALSFVGSLDDRECWECLALATGCIESRCCALAGLRAMGALADRRRRQFSHVKALQKSQGVMAALENAVQLLDATASHRQIREAAEFAISSVIILLSDRDRPAEELVSLEELAHQLLRPYLVDSGDDDPVNIRIGLRVLQLLQLADREATRSVFMAPSFLDRLFRLALEGAPGKSDELQLTALELLVSTLEFPECRAWLLGLDSPATATESSSYSGLPALAATKADDAAEPTLDGSITQPQEPTAGSAVEPPGAIFDTDSGTPATVFSALKKTDKCGGVVPSKHSPRVNYPDLRAADPTNEANCGRQQQPAEVGVEVEPIVSVKQLGTSLPRLGKLLDFFCRLQQRHKGDAVLRLRVLMGLSRLTLHSKDVRVLLFDTVDFGPYLTKALKDDSSQKVAASTESHPVNPAAQAALETLYIISLHHEFKLQLLHNSSHTALLAALRDVAHLLLVDQKGAEQETAQRGNDPDTFDSGSIKSRRRLLDRTLRRTEPTPCGLALAGTLSNLMRSREDTELDVGFAAGGRPRNEKEPELDSEQREALRELFERLPAHSKPVPTGSYDRGSKDTAVEFRRAIVSSGLVPILVTLCGSATPGALAATLDSFNLLTTQVELRGQLAQQGAVGGLLMGLKALKACGSGALRKVADRGAQALAHLCISVNPQLFAYSERLGVVPSLLDLLEHSYELYQYEAALALTNLTAVNADARDRVFYGNGWARFIDLAASDNDLCRAAGLEGLCNLALCQPLQTQLAGGARGADIQLLFAFLGEIENTRAQSAAAGCLAMLATNAEVVARNITHAPNVFNVAKAFRRHDDFAAKPALQIRLLSVISSFQAALELFRCQRAGATVTPNSDADSSRLEPHQFTALESVTNELVKVVEETPIQLFSTEENVLALRKSILEIRGS